MAYLSLKKDYVERTLEEANKRAIKELGEEEGSNRLLWDIEDEIGVTETEDGTIHFGGDTDIGYIAFDWEPTMDDEIELVERVVKRLNKFKSMLEALK